MKKAPTLFTRTVLFIVQKVPEVSLFTLSSLMACPCQKLSVFVFPHFFSSFFYNAAQQITSNNYFFEKRLSSASLNQSFPFVHRFFETTNRLIRI